MNALPTIEQLVAGMVACRANATELILESKALKEGEYTGELA
jgi:hypothetical protein